MSHYAGFDPGTVRVFRKMIQLPELTWEDKKDINQFDDTNYTNRKLIRQKQKQISISDFPS
jgi:hypothetical protein